MSIQIKPDMADRIQVSNEACRAEGQPRAKRNWRLIGGAAAVVVLAVAAIALASGWLSGGSERMARSSAEIPLIKADEAPLKVRPEDPGGMEVPNRDMLVYRRFEGGNEPPPVERLLPSAEQPVVPPRPKAAPGREVEIVEAESVPTDTRPKEEAIWPPPEEDKGRVMMPKPSKEAPAAVKAEEVAKPEPPPVPEKPMAPAPRVAPAPASSPKPVAGAYQVQLVAVRSREQAQASWGRLSKKHADLLGGLRPNIVRADLGSKGVIYRLRAGPAGDEGKARALCASLAKRKVDCLVVRPSG